MAGKKTFDYVVNHIWKIRVQFDAPNFYFDYPNYVGLPKRYSSRLSSEFVDAIQDCTFHLGDFTRKRSWARYLRQRLFDLGERVTGYKNPIYRNYGK